MQRKELASRKGSRCLVGCALVVADCWGATSARADTWTWTGNGIQQSNFNWSSALNWTHVPVSSNSPTPVSGSSAAVIFAGSLGNLPNQDIANPFQLNSLSINSGATSFILQGNALDFVSNPANVAPTITQSGSGNSSLLENVTLDANTTIEEGSPLSINGTINGGGALIDSNSSSLILATGNSYTGGTTLNAGVLSINSGRSLGTGLLTFNGGQLNSLNNTTLTQPYTDTTTSPVGFSAATGTTLNLSNTLGTMTTANNLTFGSPGNAGIVVFEPQAIALEPGFSQGTLTVADGTVSGPGGDLSAIIFTYNTTIAGGATMDLAGTSARIPNLTGAGTLQLGTNTAMTLTLQGANFSGSIIGSGSLVLPNAQAVLSGANSYSGPTTLSNSTAGIGNGSAFSSGAVTVTTTSDLYAAGADQTLANPITVNSGQTLVVKDDPNGAKTLSFTGPLTGSGSLVMNGTDRLVLGGAQMITGGYVVNSGTLEFENSLSLQPGLDGIITGMGGTVKFDPGVSVSGGFLGGTGTYVIGGNSLNSTSTSNGTIVNQFGATQLTDFTNGGVLTDEASLVWNIGANSASGVLNVDNAVTTSSFVNDGVINIASGATLANAAANLFLGGGSRMYIGTAANPGGSLILQNGTTLEVNGALLVNNGTITGTTDVNFGGFAEGAGTYGPVNVTTGGVFQPGFTAGAPIAGNGAMVSALSGNGTVDNQSAGGTIGLLVNAASTSSFDGVIQNSTGKLSLTLEGSGGLVLSSSTTAGGVTSNTYSGGTTILGGTLTIASSGALPTASAVNNDAVFSIQSGNNASPVIAGNLIGTGSLQIGTAGLESPTIEGYLKLAPHTGPDAQNTLSIASGSTLDLTDNTLAINYGAGNVSPLATIQAAIASGYDGGKWNGPGIISSTAATNSAYAVSYADGSTDSGTTAAANQVLMKLTLIGDANLDGSVNLTDLLDLLNSYGQTGRDWTQGDFNYDGSVNLTDLLDLLNNYGQSATLANTSFTSSQVVPEPASASVLALAGLGILGRWRLRKMN